MKEKFTRPVSVKEVLECVAKEVSFNLREKITVEQILSKSRNRPLPFARHLVIFFLSEYEGKTNEKIGYALGGMDQSVTFYAKTRIRSLMKESHFVRGIVNSIKEKLYDE